MWHYSSASVCLSPIQPIDLPAALVNKHQQEQSLIRRAERLNRYEQVHQLHQQGWSQIAISRSLNLSPKTVRRYLASAVFPEHRSPLRISQLDPYKAYLVQRWNDGCHNAVQLRHEISSQGYGGGITQVRDYVARLRKAQANANQTAHSMLTLPEALLATTPLTPRRTAYLLLQAADSADETYQSFLTQFWALFPELQPTVVLFQAFATMVRERQEPLLTALMQPSLQSDCASLKKFVRGLQNDEKAVRTALSQPWSNGHLKDRSIA